MKRALSAAAAVLIVGGSVSAHADAADTVLVSGYVLSLGFSGIATAVNGISLAYDQPSTRGWRILGMAAGSLDIAIGTGLLIGANDRTSGVVLGSLAVGLGAAALTTGYFAGEDIHLSALPTPTGAVVTVAGRF
jgi:hypothetical protein